MQREDAMQMYLYRSVPGLSKDTHPRDITVIRTSWLDMVHMLKDPSGIC